jgi:hypothetical protein
LPVRSNAHGAIIDEIDGWSYIEPLMIASLDEMKKSPPGGNGKKRR